jgi:hypothetical protein
MFVDDVSVQDSRAHRRNRAHAHFVNIEITCVIHRNPLMLSGLTGVQYVLARQCAHACAHQQRSRRLAIAYFLLGLQTNGKQYSSHLAGRYNPQR